MADILVSGGTVITMDPDRRIIEDGAVAVEGDSIVAVGPRYEVEAQHTAPTTIDARRHVVLPGLIDGHGHAGHGLTKNLGNYRTMLWGHTADTIYAEGATEEFWYAEALLTTLERLTYGTTCGVTFFGGGTMVMRTDDPVYADRHSEAVEQVGIREFLTIGPSCAPYPRTYARWDGGSRRDRALSFDEQLATSAAVVERWHRKAGGRINVSLMFPVHNPGRTPLDAAGMAELKAQARAVNEVRATHGLLVQQDGHSTGTVKFALEELDMLGPHALLSHSTGLTAEEVQICADTDSVIVHNPSSGAIYAGYCPVPDLLDAGVRVMLGSDGTGPDMGYDMFRHMFQCIRHHRTHNRDSSFMPPGKVLEMATIDAARALGVADEIGSLEPGKKADVILVNMRQPHLYPPILPIDRLVSYASGTDVDTVMVGGRVLMRDRKVLSVDVDQVLDTAQRENEALFGRMPELRELLQVPEGFWGRSRYPS